MIDSPLTPDFEELERLSIILRNITGDSSDQKYSTVLSTGKEQVFLLKDGDPILRFGITANDEDLAFQNGMKLIDNLMSNLENLRHFVLLYDHAALARKIEFQFIKNRVAKAGVLCIRNNRGRCRNPGIHQRADGCVRN